MRNLLVYYLPTFALLMIITGMLVVIIESYFNKEQENSDEKLQE